MPRINTYGLQEKDFKRAFLSTVNHDKIPCPKCKAIPGEPCKNRTIFTAHTERMQALFDKCKSVLENVKGEKYDKDVWLNLGE